MLKVIGIAYTLMLASAFLLLVWSLVRGNVLLIVLALVIGCVLAVLLELALLFVVGKLAGQRNERLLNKLRKGGR